MDNRFPKLVQLGDKVEIGTTDKYISATDDSILLIDSNNNPVKLTTGNLHIKGNLLIDTGHITEFDVGTAIFKDKMLELGASFSLDTNNADGSGIMAVNTFVVNTNVQITGKNTNTINIEIPSYVFLELRKLTLGTSVSFVDLDITTCSNMEDLYNVIQSNSTASEIFTCTINEGKSIVTCKLVGAGNFEKAEAYSYGGPNIKRKQNDYYSGWVIDEKLGINENSIDCTVSDPEGVNKSDFNIVTYLGNTITVRQGYENYISKGTDLINKAYLDKNYTNNTSVQVGFHNKGIEFINGYVDCNLNNNSNPNIDFSNKQWTIITPWVKTANFNLNPTSILCFYVDGQQATDYMEIAVTTDSVSLIVEHGGETNEYKYKVSSLGDNCRICFTNLPSATDEGFKNIITAYINDTVLLTYDTGDSYLIVDTPFYSYNKMSVGKGNNTQYKGVMFEDLLIFNKYMDDYSIRYSQGTFVYYSDQWTQMGSISSGPLYKGHTYMLNYVDGDFTSCGMQNESGVQYCSTTATPTWGSSTATMDGCVGYWLFGKRLVPNIDIVDIAYKRHGNFIGDIYYNDPVADSVSLLSYI